MLADCQFFEVAYSSANDFWRFYDVARKEIGRQFKPFVVRSSGHSWIMFNSQGVGAETEPPPYVNIINMTLVGKIKDTSVKFEKKDTFKHHDFITSWGSAPLCKYPNHQSFDYFLLFNKKTRKLELYGENLKCVKEMDVFPRKDTDTNIWHSPNLMPARAFPYLLIYEDNWGFDRERMLPLHSSNQGMNVRRSGELWRQHYISNPNPSRRTNVFNVMTGKVEWEVNGVFSAELLTENLMRIPNVAKNGQMGNSIVKNGKEIAFLPYNSFLPQVGMHFMNASTQGHHKKAGLWSKFAFSDCMMDEERITVIDYKDMTLCIPKLNAKLDNSTFPRILPYVFALVTKKYDSGEKSYRDIIIMKGEYAKHPFEFVRTITVPTDILGRVKGKCFAWVTVRGLEIYINGKVYLVKGVVK